MPSTSPWYSRNVELVADWSGIRWSAYLSHLDCLKVALARVSVLGLVSTLQQIPHTIMLLFQPAAVIYK